ncbi:MAG: alanine racemase [Clostridiaceae bacterium]|nr:alanine racemase [Clostridiaceae bacterium]
MRQSVLQISKNAFKYNINQIKEIVGKDRTIMPVIKANAYGTYINKNIDLINEFEIVAVAIVQEGVELRKLGYNKEIFLLNQPYKEDIEDIIKNDITVGVASKEFIEELGKNNKQVKVHIELETGMGRTGVYIKDIEDFIKLLKKYNNIKVQGIYTHLSSPDFDYDYTNRQIELFEIGVEKIKKEFNNIKYIHCSASNGILNFKKGVANLARAGIIMYGYPASDTTFQKIDLKPVAKLKSKISFIKEVEPETSISYGRTFISKEKMKIATVGIGYADGIRRELSNVGSVVILGEKAKIVGKVCMDSFMVDVTKIENVKVGDDVYIWDNEKVLLEDIAQICKTINYEILCNVSERVPREFVD